MPSSLVASDEEEEDWKYRMVKVSKAGPTDGNDERPQSKRVSFHAHCSQRIMMDEENNSFVNSHFESIDHGDSNVKRDVVEDLDEGNESLDFVRQIVYLLLHHESEPSEEAISIKEFGEQNKNFPKGYVTQDLLLSEAVEKQKRSNNTTIGGILLGLPGILFA
jgi:hypothetical protein